MKEESLPPIFDSLPLGLVLHGADGLIIQANPAARIILGHGQQSITGCGPCDNRWSPKLEDGSDLPPSRHPALLALDTGKPVEAIMLSIANPADGSRRWLKVSAAPAKSGSQGAVYSILQDLTEQRQLEKELAITARFPGENPHPVMRILPDNTLSYANRSSQELLDCLGACQGKPVPGFLAEAVAQAEIDGGCRGLEAKTGEKCYYLMVCPVKAEGYSNVYGMDITERKQAERLLRKERDFIETVLQMAGSLVMVLDNLGRIQRFNRACEDTFNYTFSEVKGRVYWDFLLLAPEAEKAKASFNRLSEESLPGREDSLYQTKQGEPRLITWSNTALYGDTGQVEFIIRTGLDITERQRAEKSQAREMLSLEGMSAPIPAGVTASTLGLKSLRESAPGLYVRLVKNFVKLLNVAVEMLAVKIDYDIQKDVATMGKELASLRAGPREAVEIFVEALKKICAKAPPEKCRAYREEGRILLIELLGKLTVYYRNHCLGTALPATANAERTEGDGS